jgi:sec-independent protein translocase protein TatA
MAIGPFQILIVVLLLVLLFGRGKISALMGDVAKGITSFKKGLKDGDEDSKSDPKVISGDSTPAVDPVKDEEKVK